MSKITLKELTERVRNGEPITMTQEIYNQDLSWFVGRDFRRIKYGPSKVQKSTDAKLKLKQRRAFNTGEGARIVEAVIMVKGNKYWYEHTEIEFV